MTKRGRPPGSTSRLRNPLNVAAHHANVLLELWLADAPVAAIRVMLNPKLQSQIEECWRARGSKQRYTVPVKIKRKLCRLAIAHVVELHHDVIRRKRAEAAKTELRMQGYNDTQIDGIPSRTAPAHIYFEELDVEKVLCRVNRKALGITLRRVASRRRGKVKVRPATDEREAAYQEYIRDLTSAWKAADRS